MKYIIKNCPSCRNYNVFGLPKEGCCYHYMDYCKNYSNCLLKQIVEKCKHMQAEFDAEVRNGKYQEKFKWFKSGRSDAGGELLYLIEIEEINE